MVWGQGGSRGAGGKGGAVGGPTLAQRGAAVLRLLSVYARQRSLCAEIQRDRRRVPVGLTSELRRMEQEGAVMIAPLNPLFFQRFDQHQLERMITTMPILKLSKGVR